jgi:hypothetical protein
MLGSAGFRPADLENLTFGELLRLAEGAAGVTDDEGANRRGKDGWVHVSMDQFLASLPE